MRIAPVVFVALVGFALSGCAQVAPHAAAEGGSERGFDYSDVNAIADALKPDLIASTSYFASEIDSSDLTAVYSFRSDPGQSVRDEISQAFATGAPSYSVEFEISPSASVRADAPLIDDQHPVHIAQP